MGYVLGQVLDLAYIVVDLAFYLLGLVLTGVRKLLIVLGLKGDLTSHAALTYILALIILAAFTYLAAKIISRWVYNSIVGLLALFLLRFIGFDVPISLFTMVVVALFGLGGLIAVLVLYVAGVFPKI